MRASTTSERESAEGPEPRGSHRCSQMCTNVHQKREIQNEANFMVPPASRCAPTGCANTLRNIAGAQRHLTQSQPLRIMLPRCPQPPAFLDLRSPYDRSATMTPTRAHPSATLTRAWTDRRSCFRATCRAGACRPGFALRRFFFLVATPERSHPFPSRTRKLSSPGPMVLQAQACGRVGRCRGFEGPLDSSGLSSFSVVVFGGGC